MVEPSCAVTTIVMVLAPTARFIGVEAEPEATAVPFTVTVAVASVTVGVIVIEETEYAAEAL